MIPIYTTDVIKKELPNKAVVIKQKFENWREIKDENFLFSLYSKDVILIKEKGQNEIIGYYNDSDINSAGITMFNHDKSQFSDGKKEFRKSIQNLEKLEKFEVDLLGNLRKVNIPEKRQGFASH